MTFVVILLRYCSVFGVLIYFCIFICNEVIETQVNPISQTLFISHAYISIIQSYSLVIHVNDE